MLSLSLQICSFSCFLACLTSFYWKPSMVYQVIGSEVSRSVVWGLMFVHLARCWIVFTVCCSCRCQRIQISPVLSVLSPLWTLGFPDFCSWESVCILQLFQLKSSHYPRDLFVWWEDVGNGRQSIILWLNLSLSEGRSLWLCYSQVFLSFFTSPLVRQEG